MLRRDAGNELEAEVGREEAGGELVTTQILGPERRHKLGWLLQMGCGESR